MKKGYDVFGKAFGCMMRNDLHAHNSVDHFLMQEMILIDDCSVSALYSNQPTCPDMSGHELFRFAQQFKGVTDSQTIDSILQHCADIAAKYDVPFEDMRFGGTEKEILERGTDWCADMARVGAVLLMCCGIPARVVHLANTSMAYYGHVVTEAYYENKYGVCDFLHGYRFHNGMPLDTYQLIKNKAYLSDYPNDYAGLFTAAAISEYDPNAGHNYSVSSPNDYTLKLINTDHQGKWFMGEDTDL